MPAVTNPALTNASCTGDDSIDDNSIELLGKKVTKTVLKKAVFRIFNITGISRIIYCFRAVDQSIFWLSAKLHSSSLGAAYPATYSPNPSSSRSQISRAACAS